MADSIRLLAGVSAQSLTYLLQGLGAITPDTPRYVVTITDTQARQIRLDRPTPEGDTWTVPLTVEGGQWAIVHALVQALRAQGVALDTTALGVETRTQTIGLLPLGQISAWVAAASRPVIADGPAQPLAAHDSAAVVALDQIFDAGLLYPGGRVPSGIRVVGLALDEAGEVLRYDRPDQAPQPLPSREARDLATDLVGAVTTQHPSYGVLIDVRSGRVSAASRAAFGSAVLKQALPTPQRDEIDLITWVAVMLPQSFTHMLSLGRSFATSLNPLIRMLAAICCPAFLLIGLICYWFLYEAGVKPILAFQQRTPGFTLLTEVSVVTVAGTTVTLALLLAWLPTLLQHVGMVFSGSAIWGARVYWAVTFPDVFCATLHWQSHLDPAAQVADFVAHNPDAPGVLQFAIRLCWEGAAIGLGVVSSIGAELVGLCALAMALALSPAVPWAVEYAVQGAGASVAHIWAALQRITDAWASSYDDAMTQLGPATVITDGQGRVIRGAGESFSQRLWFALVVLIVLVVVGWIGYRVLLAPLPSVGGGA